MYSLGQSQRWWISRRFHGARAEKETVDKIRKAVEEGKTVIRLAFPAQIAIQSFSIAFPQDLPGWSAAGASNAITGGSTIGFRRDYPLLDVP